MTSPKTDKQRLPTNILPTHYDVAIQTDLESTPPTFLGEAVITLNVASDDTELSFNLNSSAVKITHLALSAGSAAVTQLDIATISFDEEWEVATVDLMSVGGIKTGEAKLFVRWEGELSGNMNGYYKSVGTPDENGNRPV
jgi:aminopeptidase 2